MDTPISTSLPRKPFGEAVTISGILPLAGNITRGPKSYALVLNLLPPREVTTAWFIDHDGLPSLCYSDASGTATEVRRRTYAWACPGRDASEQSIGTVLFAFPSHGSESLRRVHSCSLDGRGDWATLHVPLQLSKVLHTVSYPLHSHS